MFDNFALFGQATLKSASSLPPDRRTALYQRQAVVYHSRTRFRPASASISVYDSSAGRARGGGNLGVRHGVPRPHETTTNFSGKAGLQFDVSDDVMAYATYARGYKGPAYNVFYNLARPPAPM